MQAAHELPQGREVRQHVGQPGSDESSSPTYDIQTDEDLQTPRRRQVRSLDRRLVTEDLDRGVHDLPRPECEIHVSISA